MEILRQYLANITLVRDGLSLFRKGPTAWTVRRGEDYIESFPHYRQYGKNVFAYAKSVAQGPPEQALETCRNVYNEMDTFCLMTPAMAKKRPTIHERLGRIAHQYEQIRILSALADVASPRPDGRASGTEPDEILSRFGAVGFKSNVRDDLRLLRNGFFHIRMRYEAEGVRIYDENNQFVKTFNTERIKHLDKMLSELFDWTGSIIFGALLENPTLVLMFVVLILHEPDLMQSWQEKWNAVQKFNPTFFKTLQSGRKARQKKSGDQDQLTRTREQSWYAIFSSIPKELSSNELTVRIGNVIFDIVLEIRALSRDFERFLSAAAQRSRVPSLKDLLLKGANAMQSFAIPLLTNEDYEGHLISEPNISELLEAFDKANIAFPNIGVVRKYLQTDYPIAAMIEKKVASPSTDAPKEDTAVQETIGLLISLALFTLANGTGPIRLPDIDHS